MILNLILIGLIVSFFAGLAAWALSQTRRKGLKKYDPKNVHVYFKGVKLEPMDGKMITYKRDQTKMTEIIPATPENWKFDTETFKLKLKDK
jgi:hypothetical protein